MITLTDKAAQYATDGQTAVEGVVESELTERVVHHMESVINAEYETGVEPIRFWYPGDDPGKIVKIDQPQLSDRTILEFVSHSGIGRVAAEIVGADLIQVWVVQLLRRPVSPALGNIGWHQDLFYWRNHWDGDVFTAWVAVSDIPAESGPLTYVVGSHEWGLLDGSDFFASDTEAVRRNLDLPEGAVWRERPAIVSAGAVSFHHRCTLHSAGANRWTQPQYSFALHLRTERCTPKNDAGKAFGFDLDDTEHFPVLFQR